MLLTGNWYKMNFERNGDIVTITIKSTRNSWGTKIKLAVSLAERIRDGLNLTL